MTMGDSMVAEAAPLSKALNGVDHIKDAARNICAYSPWADLAEVMYCTLLDKNKILSLSPFFFSFGKHLLVFLHACA